MAMSGQATLTDPATNGAAGDSVFINPARLSKFTKDKIIVFNIILVGEVLLIIISSYLLPRIAKVYWNSSHFIQ